MVMIISRFHRLIQSRVLWAAILLIVVFMFVIWGMRMPGASRRAAEQNAAGKLNGKPVSREEFQRAYFNTYMAIVLSLGRAFEINPNIDAQLREAAWRRLAALREAGQLGIRTTDEEVQATIQAYHGFQINSQFSPAAYSAFVQNVLARHGFNAVQFEEHVREEITLQKLQRVIQNLILVAPTDIMRTFRSLLDVFTVEYVTLRKEDVADTVSVTEQDAYGLYQSDPDAFAIPPQVLVRYVEIPASRFLAESTVTNETDALSYYDEHIAEFMVTNMVTNTVLEGQDNAEEPAVAVVTARVETLSFDLVKPNIMELLTQRAAMEKASDFATELVITLTPDREGNAPAFDEVMKSHNLEIKSLPPFSLEDDLPGIQSPEAFRQAAFMLRPNPEEYVSDAIQGSNVVYVVALVERYESRIPAFEEVKELALRRAKEKAIQQALTKKAEGIRDHAVKTITEGGTFKDAVKPYGLELNHVVDFSLSNENETNTPPSILIRGILPRNEGEVTDLLETDEGIIIGCIVARKPGDMSAFSALSPQIRDTIRQQRGRLLFHEWQSYLLKQGNLVDLLAKREASESEESEAPDEDTTDAASQK